MTPVHGVHVVGHEGLNMRELGHTFEGGLHHEVLDGGSTCVDLAATRDEIEFPYPWIPVVLEVGHLGHCDHSAVACGECSVLVHRDDGECVTSIFARKIDA